MTAAPLTDDERIRIAQAAENHVTALEAADPDDPLDFLDTITADPYCGCATCILREGLAAAFTELDAVLEARA